MICAEAKEDACHATAKKFNLLDYIKSTCKHEPSKASEAADWAAFSKKCPKWRRFDVQNAQLNAEQFNEWFHKYPVTGGPRQDQLKGYAWFDSNPGWHNSRPLHRAAMRGDVESIKRLCKNNTSDSHDPNEKMSEWFDSVPLGWAASFGHLDAVIALIQYGADPQPPMNKAGFTPLTDAQRENHNHVVTFLEEYQRRVGVLAHCPRGEQSCDRTPDNEEMLEICAEVEVDACHASAEKVKWNVLHYIESKCRATKEADLKLGSTPTQGNPPSNNKLNTELNNVARNTNDVTRVRQLVMAGADLASTNGGYWRHTPLHQAAYHGRYEVAKVLLELGARTDLPSNPCGRGATGTPVELARGGGHYDIVKLIENAAEAPALKEK